MIEWFTQIQNTYVNGYGFKYDGLNRLKAGRFFSRFDASAVVEPMPTYYADGIVSGIGSEKEITYDKNGNILTLNRYGHHSGGTVLFDQLSYQYDGNRLMRVIDANPNSFLSGEFCNTAAPNLQNSYDANGNLTFDVDRNMLLFYNDDNLPTNISFSNWAMTNGYRVDGVKMSKSMYNAEGRTVLQEEYFGNLVLNFGKPVRILHADGVIELNASLQPTFYYYLKDHLGNIRAVVSPTATNSVHIDQTSEYYPFGMNISKNFTSTSINKYKYNGKEEQEMPGHWLDYGARFYDPQMGRFTIVDPLAHKYYSLSPFAYCANNPIKFIDPDGQKIVLAGTAAERQVTLTHLQRLTNDKLSIRKDGTLIITKLGGENSSKTLNTGTNLIRNLNKKDAGSKTMTISIGTPGSGNSESDKNSANAINGKGSDVTVNFDPSANPSIPTKDPVTGNVSGATRPDEIGLAHKMIHGERSMDGKATNYSTTDTYTYTDAAGNTVTQTVPKEELQTVGLKGNNPNDYTENKIRKEQGLNERGAY